MPPSKPPPPAFSTSYALSKFRMQRPAQAWLCGRPKPEQLPDAADGDMGEIRLWFGCLPARALSPGPQLCD